MDFTSDRKALGDATARLWAWRPAPAAREHLDVGRYERKPPGTEGADIGSIVRDQNPMLDSLLAIVNVLKTYEGPKTLLFIGSSLPTGYAQLTRYTTFARAAAEARVTVYAIRPVAVTVDIETDAGLKPDKALN